ncbi:hypothetical protein WS62_24555 [Burkholderia sp. ABCPW 14]|nr:hypothetical protein WS62_24555 [Burkholderia sp. ABCPW 14]
MLARRVLLVGAFPSGRSAGRPTSGLVDEPVGSPVGEPATDRSAGRFARRANGRLNGNGSPPQRRTGIDRAADTLASSSMTKRGSPIEP